MALFINVKVIPKSRRQRCTLDVNDTLKCYLISAPEGGKANNELIKLLSKSLRIAQHSITIVRGVTSRTKRIKIEADLSFDDVCVALGSERQGSLDF